MRSTAFVLALLVPAAATAQPQQNPPPTQQNPPPTQQTRTPPESAALNKPALQVWSDQTTIDWPLLQLIPFESRFAFAAVLLAPGVNPNNFSAYGSGGETSNAYSLDGAPMNDPETGGTWVFANYNWIQTVEVDGLRGNAEQGGFTGVAALVKLRSGTDELRGLVETLFQNDSLRFSNTSSERLTPPKTDYTTDTNVQLGGPLKRERAWFFAAAEYYRPKSTPPGFPSAPPTGYQAANGPRSRVESSPRFLFKPTYEHTPTSTFEGFIEADNQNAEAHDAAANVAPEATLRQSSPEAAWNGTYKRILSMDSTLNVAYSGFRGSFKLTPYNGDIPGWYDADEDYYAVNAFYRYKADRIRNRVLGSLTRSTARHYAKTGVEFERSIARSEYAYNGGKLIEASSGTPFFALLYDGYSKDDTTTRISAYAQDQWNTSGRFMLTGGVRFDRVTGTNTHAGDQVFATNSVAPRAGFVWEAGATTFRGHYGWYFDAARTSYFDLIDPDIHPIYGVDIDRRLNPIGSVFVDTPGRNHTIDGSLKQPRMQQATLGLERRLFGLQTAITGIYRRTDHFIDDVLDSPRVTPADFPTLAVADPGPDGANGNSDDTNTAVTLYRQRSNPLNNAYLITNPSGAFRQYEGIQIAATRAAERWMLHGSYVLSRTTGNYDNISDAGNDPTEYNDPNTDPRTQPLRRGRLTHDNTHLAKAIGTYRGPLGLLLSGVFYYTSGDTFTRTLRTTRAQTPQGRIDVFVEPRGASRYDAQLRLDARVERQFRVAGGRLGAMVEGFNLTNDATITAQTTRSGLFFGTPQAIVPGRRLRVGATYRF